MAEQTFIQPVIQGDGILGGETFAVSASSWFRSFCPYCIMDDSNLTYWKVGCNEETNDSLEYTPYITIYNPFPIKLNDFVWVCMSSEERPTQFRVYGYNNIGEAKTLIKDNIRATVETKDQFCNILSGELNNTIEYKYYDIQVLEFNGAGNSALTCNKLTINATYNASAILEIKSPSKSTVNVNFNVGEISNNKFGWEIPPFNKTIYTDTTDKTVTATYTKQSPKFTKLSVNYQGGTIMALKNDGSVWGVGTDYYGEFGNGVIGTGVNMKWSQYQTGTTFKDIVNNYGTVYFIDENDDVWGCGNSANYVLEGYSNATQGSLVCQTIPVKLSVSKVKKVIPESGMTGILGLDGKLYVSGVPNATYGAFGTKTTYTKFTVDTPNTIWKEMAGGQSCQIGISSENDMAVVYGNNTNAQLGTSNTSAAAIWTNIGVYSSKFCVVNSQNGFIIKNDGTVYGCGLNRTYSLGNGTNTQVKTFFPLPDLPNNVIKIITAAGSTTYGNFSMAITDDGLLYATGAGKNYQFGNNSTTTLTRWTLIDTINDVVDIATPYTGNSYFALAIKKDGAIWGCGQNSVGALGETSSIVYKTWTKILEP